jgi:epoxyqueuosine reductase QueG
MQIKKKENYLKMKKFATKEGASLFGVADLTKVKTDDFLISENILAKLPYAISIGFRVSPTVLEEIVDHPTQLYFHHYRQINSRLDQIALKISNYIGQLGYSALPIAASQIVDWQNQRAHLSHKRIGNAAGLGWIGRNNLLVNDKYGCQFRLVTILSDMPLITDKPVNKDCGKCHKCIETCPAQAIKEEPEDFLHIQCFEKLKEFQKKGYVGQYICGICIKACQGEEQY